MHSDLKEYRVYQQLIALSPTLEERLCTGSEQELFHVADMVRSFLLILTPWRF